MIDVDCCQELPTEELNCGDFAIAFYKGKPVVGLVVLHKSGAKGFVMLSPGHPLTNKPGLVLLSSLANQSVVRLLGARAVVSDVVVSLRQGYDGPFAPSGALFRLDDETCLSVQIDNYQASLFVMRNGMLVDEEPALTPWFSSWSVAVPNARGDLIKVCDVSV